MPVRITLDAMINARGIKARDLAAAVHLSETQLSLFRSCKVKGIRFSSLSRLCAVLECRPGDLIDYAFDPADLTTSNVD